MTAATGITVMNGDSGDSHACAWEKDDSSGVPTFQVRFTANIHLEDTGCAESGVSGATAETDEKALALAMLPNL